MKSMIPWKRGQKSAAPARSNDWFAAAWDEPFGWLFPSRISSRLPAVDVTDDKKEIKVRAEIPGMTEKDIDLTWNDGVLTIRGEKRGEKEEKKNGRYYRECSYGSFCRNIATGKGVDWQNAKARYKNGVLTVALPKTALPDKTIKVTVQ